MWWQQPLRCAIELLLLQLLTCHTFFLWQHICSISGHIGIHKHHSAEPLGWVGLSWGLGGGVGGGLFSFGFLATQTDSGVLIGLCFTLAGASALTWGGVQSFCLSSTEFRRTLVSSPFWQLGVRGVSGGSEQRGDMQESQGRHCVASFLKCSPKFFIVACNMCSCYVSRESHKHWGAPGVPWSPLPLRSPWRPNCQKKN